MTNSSRLESRYRRLLAVYPKAYRREHEQEILSTLMAAAREGQERPGLAEAADLLRNGMRMWLRQRTLPSAWEYRHFRLMVMVRLLVGVWLVLLTAVMYGYGKGGWWGALLIPAALLHFLIVYRLAHPPEDPPGESPRGRSA